MTHIPPRDADSHVRPARVEALLERLVAIPSPTGAAGAVAEALADFLQAEGIAVDRPDAGHPTAPAVVARLRGHEPGRTLQFDGHLDTVHLPFAPPRREGDRLWGSGTCDMKGGIAAAVEAMLALRDAGLPRGQVLFTAHDLHEAPWGRGQQLDALIAAGCVGDAALIPEPIADVLPVAGRGQACWSISITRHGPPVHEVFRPLDEPSVIAACAGLVDRLQALDSELAREVDPVAGRSSVFIGQIHAGEIFNQFPQQATLAGTRRWIPSAPAGAAEQAFRQLVATHAAATGTTITLDLQPVRGAFQLDPACRLAQSFQQAHAQVAGAPLPTGPKPFVDDGNSFWSLAGIPAITHGPRGGGQHTTQEWVSLSDLVRVARVYVHTAHRFLNVVES